MNGRFHPNDFPAAELKRLRAANAALVDTNQRYWKMLQDQRQEIILLKMKVEEMTRNVPQQ